MEIVASSAPLLLLRLRCVHVESEVMVRLGWAQEQRSLRKTRIHISICATLLASTPCAGCGSCIWSL
jgi:hypothetical protein